MSTGTHPLARFHAPHHLLLWVLVGLGVVAALALTVDRAAVSHDSTPQRPELQQPLDLLVRGGAAPGVTAYVVGPHGTWAGSAGVAETVRGTAMPADARMRIESNSKTWLVAVILQLAQEGKLGLDDTVDDVLPGLLRGHGSRITVRELLTDSSGLIDDNDVYRATAKQKAAMLARVNDPKLRAQLLAMAARLRASPSATVPALLFVELAAWQRLVAEPGTAYHHSNIGWNVAGMVAAKAAGKPLPQVYRERLFEPLGLTATAWSPQGPIAGEHAHGYARANGRLADTTATHPGKFSDGAIVTSAHDEATFLRAAMSGALFPRTAWTELYGTLAPTTACGGPAFSGWGAGDGYQSYVRYSADGNRVAVLLVNEAPDSTKANAAEAAAILRLYCKA